MSERLIRPPFNPGGPLVALKTVRLEGRTVERGELVPATLQRDLSASTLRGLWAQGFFDCAESLEAVEDFVKADTVKAFKAMNPSSTKKVIGKRKETPAPAPADPAPIEPAAGG